jgi:hypothetical protein
MLKGINVSINHEDLKEESTKAGMMVMRMVIRKE